MKPEIAWSMRPTGPLSNLYLSDEQTKAVYAWLDMLAAYTLDAAREAVAAKAMHSPKCFALLPDFDERDCNCAVAYSIAAIDALKEKP